MHSCHVDHSSSDSSNAGVYLLGLAQIATGICCVYGYMLNVTAWEVHALFDCAAARAWRSWRRSWGGGRGRGVWRARRRNRATLSVVAWTLKIAEMIVIKRGVIVV